MGIFCTMNYTTYMFICGAILGAISASQGITYSADFWKAVIINVTPIIMLGLAPQITKK